MVVEGKVRSDAELAAKMLYASAKSVRFIGEVRINTKLYIMSYTKGLKDKGYEIKFEKSNFDHKGYDLIMTVSKSNNYYSCFLFYE